MESIVATALNQALTQLAGQAIQAIAENPQGAIDFASSLFAHPHHTGYDAIQDIWDAVEAGALSHSAAVQATVILAADLEHRSQRPAPPRPHTQPKPAELAPTSPLDVIRGWAEYQALQR